MKLARFTDAHGTRIGVVLGEEIVDLCASAQEFPKEMIAFLSGGEAMMRAAAAAIDKIPSRILLKDVKLEAPIAQPGKFLAIGMNFHSHVAEVSKRSETMKGMTTPKNQIWFNKQSTCINGPYDPVELPKVSNKIDYEGELAVVIGRKCKHVSIEDAPSVIAGYTICNDVSVRDWQAHSRTMTMGKSFDTHGPIGPWIVTPEEVGDPQNLHVQTWVNNEIRQDHMTSDMIFGVYEQIAYLSTAFTLEPGDILTTGSGEGVGALMNPKQFLKAGDRVKIQIENIGFIQAEFIPES